MALRHNSQRWKPVFRRIRAGNLSGFVSYVGRAGRKETRQTCRYRACVVVFCARRAAVAKAGSTGGWTAEKCSYPHSRRRHPRRRATGLPLLHDETHCQGDQYQGTVDFRDATAGLRGGRDHRREKAWNRNDPMQQTAGCVHDLAWTGGWCGGADLSVTSGHYGRAVSGRRLDRRYRSRPGRSHARAAG